MHDLQDLLADGTRYSPWYPPSMNSDHMPMTLCAITGLGGDFEFCVNYREDYKKILQELQPAQAMTDWRRGIGRNECYPALLTWFRQRIDTQGAEATIRAHLREFTSGLALQAFHPVIRLGYAIDFGSESETAAALAYLVASHRDMPVDPGLPVDLEERMRRQAGEGPRSFDSERFSGRIEELRSTGAYPLGCAADFGACAAAALDLYRSTRNFFALHMVTATQAARLCSRFVDHRLALAALTGALLAAHKAVGSPEFDDPRPVPGRLDREHVYKYAWACLSEHRHYGNPLYAQEIRGLRDAGLIPRWCAAGEI